MPKKYKINYLCAPIGGLAEVRELFIQIAYALYFGRVAVRIQIFSSLQCFSRIMGKTTAPKRNNGSQRNSYSPESMEKAVNEVRKKNLSARVAAKKFGVPRATLGDVLRDKTAKPRKMGAPTVLSNEVEQRIVKCLFELANVGFPITKNQLIDNVASYLGNQHLPNPFKNNRPGRKWFQLFRSRHKSISIRVAENISKTRAALTEKGIRDWFTDVQRYLTEKNCFDAFNDPNRIFNLDETAVFLSPEANRVLAQRGSRIVYNVTKNNDKECVTVLLGGNAAGKLTPPMVIFKNKIFPRNVSKNLPDGWGIGEIK